MAMLVRGSSPNIATPTLAVTGSTSPRAGGRGSRRRSLRRPGAPPRGCSGAGRPRTRRRRAAPATSLSRVRRRSTSAISSISRSPAGWPWESLTCLKWSRSSISSAPVVSVAARCAPSPSRRSSSKRRRFFSPVSGSWLASRSQLLHPLVAAPDQDQRAEQGRQGDPEHRQQQRQADVRPVGVADDQQPGAVGDLDRAPGRVVERPLRPDHGRVVDPQLDVDRRAATAEIAAAARSSTRKLPAAKPISARRRCGTVAVGAPSR